MVYPACVMSPSQSSTNRRRSTHRVDGVETVREFCEQILRRGDLESKLTPPLTQDGHRLRDEANVQPIFIDAPARDSGLQMAGGSERLPRPGQLKHSEQRRICLARFAHHELMAVELFAWALLRWPDLPTTLRRGLLAALADEQRHCRLYLDRLAAHGGSFHSNDHSDYFWRQAPAMANSPNGPSAFLAAMGLTLEQANLDFTLTYRDGFASAGDHETAAVCQRVHDEEITHVALAARWLERLACNEDRPESTDLDRYLASVPFPLGPARAKGRRFEEAPRRKAGLSDDMIDFVRNARSTQERPLTHTESKA